MSVSSAELADGISERVSRSMNAALGGLLLQLFAKEMWVSCGAYRKYHSISPATLWKLQDALKSRNAMRGTGKSARFDKFFNPAQFMGRRKS